MNSSTQNSQNTVVGIFDDYSDAERAIRDLKEAGIPANRIGIATGQSGVDSQSGDGARQEGFWRKIADFFEGKDHSDDATAYNPNQDSAVYSERLGSSSVLVSVSAATPEQRKDCEEILKEHHARIEAGNVNRSAGVSGNKPDVDQSSEGGQRIQLLSEVLRVHKDRVSTGEVRVRKEVVTENQTVEVPVTREELVIERVPVHAGTPASGEIGSSQEVRIPLSEEKPRIEKKPIVKEEVKVGTKKVQEVKQVNEQVKREELHVDREDNGNVTERPKKTNVA